ncbi:MAG: DUF6599 family protein [Candidatus Acidiferrales bacterium]
MRISITMLLAVLFLCALPASAQGILPNSFGAWSGNAKPGLQRAEIFNGDKSASMSAEAKLAAITEYGFVSGENGQYARGSESLQVNLYKMKDPSGAYGLYSYLRTTDMPKADLADHSSMSREYALALAGNLVLEVNGKDVPKAAAELKALVAALAPHAESGLLPTIGQHLPTKGFIDRTDKYVLGPETLNQVFPLATGDWLGFSQGAEVATAKYRVNGREVNLLVADFPTPQTAAKRIAELQKQFHMNPPDTGAGSSSNSAPLFAKRSLTLVSIVSGAASQKEAESLLGQIETGTEITWNEPTFQFKEPGIGVMIVGAIEGTGVICMFALIAGLAFGGVRIVVKRATNRVFDRPDQVQVLQLGLSSKPINAEDFYGYRK